MSVTVTQTSKYVEGGAFVRRFSVVGDTSYPTGGYDILTAIKALPGQAAIALNRIVSIRHRTVASAQLGGNVAVDTYSGGVLSALKVALVLGAAEVSNGTNVSALNAEIITEGL